MASSYENGAISEVTFEVPAATNVRGDFNADGVADAAGYAPWRVSIGGDDPARSRR